PGRLGQTDELRASATRRRIVGGGRAATRAVRTERRLDVRDQLIAGEEHDLPGRRTADLVERLPRLEEVADGRKPGDGAGEAVVDGVRIRVAQGSRLGVGLDE